MGSFWVVLAYGCSVGLALLLLYYANIRAWAWHIASVALALFIGLIPNPFGWTQPTVDLMIGSLFTFLLVWGVGELAFHSEAHHHHRHHHPPRSA
jgi:hypothetical protein